MLPILLASGGPDAYGYRWYDSGDSVGFTWANLRVGCYYPSLDVQGSWADWWWIDPTGSPLGANPYGDTVSIYLPFDVTFFNRFYPVGTAFTVSTKGWIGLSDPTSYPGPGSENQPLPREDGFDGGLIAPFWDDLIITNSTGTAADNLYAFPVWDLGPYWGPRWYGIQGFVIVWNYFYRRLHTTFDPSNPPRMEVIITDSIVNGNNVIVWIFKGNVTPSGYTDATQGFEAPNARYGCLYRGQLRGDEVSPYVDGYREGVVVFTYSDGAPGVTVVGLWDEDTVKVPLPFNVKFYGQTYYAGTDSLLVSSNGWAAFPPYSGTSPNPYRTAIPDPSTPNALMALAWDNLLVGTVRYAHVSSPEPMFVVEWKDAYRYPGFNGPRQFDANFQLQILEDTSSTGDNRIRFCYKTTDFGASDPEGVTPALSIGIENETGSIGLAYDGDQVVGTSPNISAINPNQCVEFAASGTTVPVGELTDPNRGPFSVYNVVGAKVMEGRGPDPNLEDLPPGVYFIVRGNRVHKVIR